MIYLESPSTDPAFNLAAEEYAFFGLDRREEYFMLWQNRPAVIIGRHQNAEEEVNLPFLRANEIPVVRRLSGGGAVYHDLGNLNFTYIADGESGGLSMERFAGPLVLACRELGLSAEITGRNDVTVGGRKISGNAGYQENGRILHHGTILLSSDLERMEKALRPPGDKLVSKGTKSVRSRVTTLSAALGREIPIREFAGRLKAQVLGEAGVRPRSWEASELQRIEAIRAARYGSWEWNFGSFPACQIERRRRIEGCGSLHIGMDVFGGRIEAVTFRGDFLGNREIDGLEEALEGCLLEKEQLKRRLEEAELSEYIFGIKAEVLAGILCGEL